MSSANTSTAPAAPRDISESVANALREDVGDGDLTASLIPADRQATATIVSRQAAVLCGIPWFEEVYAQLDPKVSLSWRHGDGERVDTNAQICHLAGSARSLLTGERTALNFLQTLSATATQTRAYADLVAGTNAAILDTRKTLPGLRLAQKYAVACGGGRNHRLGLYDGILIKENHIEAAGSISAAISQARGAYPDTAVEVEVETLAQLEEALTAQPDVIMLDNFDLASTRRAVSLTAKRIKLEASGNVNRETLSDIAKTGVDYISAGALTKDVKAVDFSMRFTG